MSDYPKPNPYEMYGDLLGQALQTPPDGGYGYPPGMSAPVGPQLMSAPHDMPLDPRYARQQNHRRGGYDNVQQQYNGVGAAAGAGMMLALPHVRGMLRTPGFRMGGALTVGQGAYGGSALGDVFIKSPPGQRYLYGTE
jgi:hypothetical protein